MEINIIDSFLSYNEEINKIYEEISLIKESSTDEYNLILEGFWDKVKGAARNIGSTVGKAAATATDTIDKTKEAGTKAINNTKEIGNKAIDKTKEIGNNAVDKTKGFFNRAYDKGKELGNKMINIGKKLINDITQWVNNSIEKIKKTPGIVMNVLSKLFDTAKNKCISLYSDAKRKGGEWLTSAKTTINNIFTNIGNKISSIYTIVKDWIIKSAENTDNFIRMVDDKIQTLGGELEDMGIEGIKSIIDFCRKTWPKIKEGTINISKKAGMVALVIIVLPFVLLKKTFDKTKEMGEDALLFINSGIKSIKTNLGETWNELASGAEEGYKTNKIKKNLDKNESQYDSELEHIMNFDTFIKECYKG